MLIQGLRVRLFIFSLTNHAAGVLTVITHPGIQSSFFCPNLATCGIFSDNVVGII